MMDSLRGATQNTMFEQWLDATMRPPVQPTPDPLQPPQVSQPTLLPLGQKPECCVQTGCGSMLLELHDCSGSIPTSAQAAHVHSGGQHSCGSGVCKVSFTSSDTYFEFSKLTVQETTSNVPSGKMMQGVRA